MEKQEVVGATGGGGAGSGVGGLQGTVSSSIQDGAAAGLRLSGSNLHGAGLCPRPISSSTDERPRGILKNTSSVLVPRVPCGEKKKSQHWDEMNILATYHPLGKDYGLMKACIIGQFCPKVLQFGDNKNTGSKDKLTSKKMQKDFEWHRKAHYDEGKYLKAQKVAAQDDEEEPPDTPDGGGHALPQPPPEREFDRRRKEYYSKGTYLKTTLPTDPEEDTDKEQKDGTSGLTWVIEKPLTSQEVHLLGLAGQAPSGEQKATEKPLTIKITQSQPGTALNQKRSGSPVMSGWCHWLVTKELSWKSPRIPEKDAGESQGAPGGAERRHETLRLHWSQEEDTVQWKM